MKAILRFTLLFFIIGCFCGKVFGDGKFYITERVPADIPYQRAFIFFRENSEILILQSKYELSQSAAVDSLGWVVPVPSVPDIASVDADIAEKFFHFTSWSAQPKFHHVSVWFLLIFFLTFLGSIAFLLVYIVKYLFFKKWGRSDTRWNHRFYTTLIIACISFILVTLCTPPLAFRMATDIEVVKDKQVGIYDVKVIRSENAESILEWLKENGFMFNENDIQLFADYISRKWCFVVAKVQPEQATEEIKITYSGMVAPLILKFATEKAIYPLALTSTIGKETEILLYTFNDYKLDCNKRLELRFADKGHPDNLIPILLMNAEQETIDFFGDLPQSMILCKFKSKLTPEQMKTDIVFEFATDNKPYRETKVIW